MSTVQFHPIVRAWFKRRFGQPTDAQAQGWPAIAKGRHTLISAPTGSGKTLAAFLTALDVLVRQGLEQGSLVDQTQVVYVSPLKALSNDVHKNLEEPLREISAVAQEMGTPIPEIRIAVRTGDTPQRERALNARRPPHVLITTPESLFILLTSESGRRALTSVHTLILDELHAVASNKRGSHLAISAERLCRNSENEVTRIGLSATQKPIGEIACFLTGTSAADAPRVCTIVDVGHGRAMDVAIELPRNIELGPIATHEQWAQVLDQIAELTRAHKTTLLFVNTRRLVERVAHLLSERLGEEQIAAHHGSLARETRLKVEQRLKEGQVTVCVATGSLELGIDVGGVDLVVQVGSPRNIGVALQRVGRSGHFLGGLPKGRFFPLTRDELVETVALTRAIATGKLDALSIPPWPLDILAQQIIATTVGDDWWDERELYDFMRGAYPYRELPYERFEGVLEMLVEGVAGRFGRNGAYLYRDGVNHRVKARRGGRIATVTSGGAIPDTADYLVLTEPEGTYVGSVNEDFAIESMAGDIFLLGNSPWRIRRVEAGVMRVEEAQGQSPTIPFWLGEAPGRTLELSDEVSELRREVDERLSLPDAAIAWVMGQGVTAEAAHQVVEYLAEGKRVLGMVPTKKRLIAERFFDESGGMQLVIHSPFGSRINRAWGLALRKRFCRNFDFELQASATDEGVNLSLGPQHSFPVNDIFRYVKSNTAEAVLEQAVLQSPVFGVRWRWVASRSLALLRTVGGKRVPTPIQRMRSDDLLAAVFPAQVACQDNQLAGTDVEVPDDHPLVFETMRDCLNEALDSAGMTALLRGIESGEIEVYGKDTVQPSAFSHQILNAMPYAFLDDAPLEERRARAVALRRALPGDARDLGALDQEAIAAESANAWPTARDADELHDALMTLVLMAEEDIDTHAPEPATWRAHLVELARTGRVMRLTAGGSLFWLATERSGLVATAYPDAELSDSPWLLGEPYEPGDAVAALVRGRAESTGVFSVTEMASALALAPGSVETAIARLEGEGLLLRGQFRASFVTSGAEEFCDRRILSRIHRSTLGRLRREIEPVPCASYIRFLLEWQHVSSGARLLGETGLVKVVEQLQGYEAAAQAWETSLLPARVSDYTPGMLDSLFFSGEATWGRFARRSVGSVMGLSRNSPISLALREDVAWLLDSLVTDDEAPLLGAAAEVYDYLAANGASFPSDLISGVRRLPSEVEEGLWQLVAAGRVTADGFGALRGLIDGSTRRVHRITRRSRFGRRTPLRVKQSRWTLLRAHDRGRQVLVLGGGMSHISPEEKIIEARAAQLLRRYGIFVRELLTREPMAPPWRQLLQAFRRAESRGEIRGGRFLAGFAGEQFALPEAVDALRSTHRRPLDGEVVRVAATDPLNVIGILTTGVRIPATAGNEVLYRDGTVVGHSTVEKAG